MDSGNGYDYENDKVFSLAQAQEKMFSFGRYKGQRISDVWITNKKYCEWVINTFDGDNSTKIATIMLKPEPCVEGEDNIDVNKILELQKKNKVK